MSRKMLLKGTGKCLATVAAFILVPLIASSATAQLQQPKIGSRQIPVITVDGLKFRDLNRNGRLDPYEDWRLSPEDRAADLVSRMSLAEKAGAMVHSWAWHKSGAEYDLDRLRPMMLKQHITSGITWLRAIPSRLAQQNNLLQELSEQGRLGIPFTVSTDPRHHLSIKELGVGLSMWPETTGFGAIGDPELVRRFGDIARREYRAVGIHMALSPMADLGTEPRWDRLEGSFGEDSKQVRELVRAYVEGFQGSASGLTPDGVISVVKHWAGYGSSAYDGKYPYFSDSHSFDQHLVPFEGAFQVNVAGVMPQYHTLRGLVYKGHEMEPVASAYNKYLLTDLLRGRYAFKGLILSDWAVISGNFFGVEHLSPRERTIKAVQAGIDQFGGAEDPQYLIEAVEEGQLSESRIDEAAQRVLLLKFQIGLFENPYVSPEEAEVVTGNPESHATAFHAQQRALVLLKNENSILPLRFTGKNKRRQQRVFLVRIDATVAEAKGLSVVNDISQADLVIVRLEEPGSNPKYRSPQTSQQRPKGSLAFAPGQPDFDAVVSFAANGLPVIATVNLERAAVLTALLPHVQGLFSDFGITDEALIDTILGKAEPEGRLPFELPFSMAAVEAQKPDLPHDSESPLFPIGFGLRYQTTKP